MRKFPGWRIGASGWLGWIAFTTAYAAPWAPVPLVDLANNTARQVVIDREAGQYLGHPSTLLLEDGKTMLIAYPKGHARGAILYQRSGDGGRTWSGHLPTPASWETSKEVPTLFRTVDAKGRKRILLFSGTGAGNHELTIRRSISEDDGATWTELKSIGPYGGIAAMGSMVRRSDGAYLAFFHDDAHYWDTPENPLGKQSRVFQTVSTDGGLTWGKPQMIARHATGFLCEPGALRSPDGKQIAILMRENTRRFNSFVIFSNDEGKTWTEPREVSTALTGDRHVARYAPDGRLFIAMRDTAVGSPTFGDWVGWVGGYADIGNGGLGSYRVRLMDNTKTIDCGYSGVELLPDGTFVATTYGHWVLNEQPFVVSVRFKLPELDAKSKSVALGVAAPSAASTAQQP